MEINTKEMKAATRGGSTKTRLTLDLYEDLVAE